MGNSAGTRESFEIQFDEPALIDAETIEEIAADLHRRARQMDVAGLAEAAGCSIYYEPGMPDAIPLAILAEEGAVLVRLRPEEQRVTLAALRGISCWALRERPHSCVDECRLAQALDPQRFRHLASPSGLL